jgi:hypothetical protein
MPDRLSGITERLKSVGARTRPRGEYVSAVWSAIFETAQEKFISLAVWYVYLEQSTRSALFERIRKDRRNPTSPPMLRDGGSLRMLEYFSEIKNVQTRLKYRRRCTLQIRR